MTEEKDGGVAGGDEQEQAVPSGEQGVVPAEEQAAEQTAEETGTEEKKEAV